MMNKFLYGIALLMVGLLVYSCVDDYQDANPPRLLDAPAVWDVTAADDLITDGSSTQITIQVVDCPAGIDSVAFEIEDESGDPIGSVTIDNLDQVRGQSKADIIATYTSVSSLAVVVEITFTVYDKQFDEDGEVVRKNSVPKSAEITVVCPSDLAGTYDAVTSGSSTDGAADNNPLTGLQSTVTITETATPGTYDIIDASGGAYDAWYLMVYYGEPYPVPGTLTDACGAIAIADIEGYWGESIIASSGSVDADGVITVTAMNGYGDEWTMVLTPQ